MKRIVLVVTACAPASALAHPGHGLAAVHDHGLAAVLIVVAVATLAVALRGGSR